jgi:hypothetical protein
MPALPAQPSTFIALPHAQTLSLSAHGSGLLSTPLPTPSTAPALAPPEAIHIQLHCGPTQLHIRWPTSVADECAGWLHEALPDLLGQTLTPPLHPTLHPTLRPSRQPSPKPPHRSSTQTSTQTATQGRTPK